MIQDALYTLKRFYIAAHTAVASWHRALFSLRARRALGRRGFSRLRRLGAGKDGAIFAAYPPTKTGALVVVKYLSLYGKKFLPLTKLFLEKHIKSPHLYEPAVIDNAFVTYPFENLNQPEVNNKSFKEYLLQLCALEQTLLASGMLYWDFGFSHAPNYMVTSDNTLKITDYGGNAFLFVDPEDAVKSFFPVVPRRNLVFANVRFIALQFLLHVITIGLGRKGMERYSSSAQNASDEELAQIRNACVRELKGTSYERVGEVVLDANLCSTKGWATVADAIGRYLGSDTVLCEQADVESVTFTGDGVRVIGYQSFTITGEQIAPLQNKHADNLWDTTKKMAEVVRALDHIEKIHGRPESFLDIGSNLGLYVFLAKKRYHIPRATGVDYNPKYIRQCQDVAARLHITGCEFVEGTFGTYEEPHDVVLALGLIHHIYHRTENFGSLQKIIEKFARITKQSLILEFPTEKDTKARKWTNMPFRKRGDEYSLHHFEEVAGRYFRSVQKIGGTSPTRPIFLLEK